MELVQRQAIHPPGVFRLLRLIIARQCERMEALLRDAKEKSSEIPSSLKEQIVLEHTPLIRYIVNRIAVRLPSHIDLDQS